MQGRRCDAKTRWDFARTTSRAIGLTMNDTKPPVPFDPAAAGWQPYGHDDTGFVGLVGPFWTRQEGDKHLFAFTAAKKHHNRRGVVQGGMLMTFADRSMGMT